MVSVKTKKFSTIKKNPSLLGFGCMRFPTLPNGLVDEVQTEAMIDYAYQHGVNYFDTAYIYHGGKSESIIGHYLKKYPRDSFHLVTKMPGWLVKDLADVKRIFEEQLMKCEVDYFDYYLLHSLSKQGFEIYKKTEIIDYLFDLKKNGKIKYLGFSFHDTPEVLEEIVHYYPFDFVQLQVNYLDWDYQDAKKQYEIVAQMDLPIIVMEPVRGGALADLSVDANQILKEHHPDASIASWALRYVASLPNVLTVLSGMSNTEQVVDNIKTFTPLVELNKDEYQVLNKALQLFLKTNLIPCTGCRYCMECPAGVDIPLMFKMYNNYALDRNHNWYLKKYQALDDKIKASSCIKCGKCLKHCPQKIAIPDEMIKINRLVNSE